METQDTTIAERSEEVRASNRESIPPLIPTTSTQNSEKTTSETLFQHNSPINVLTRKESEQFGSFSAAQQQDPTQRPLIKTIEVPASNNTSITHFSGTLGGAGLSIGMPNSSATASEYMAKLLANSSTTNPSVVIGVGGGKDSENNANCTSSEAIIGKSIGGASAAEVAGTVSGTEILLRRVSSKNFASFRKVPGNLPLPLPKQQPTVPLPSRFQHCSPLTTSQTVGNPPNVIGPAFNVANNIIPPSSSLVVGSPVTGSHNLTDRFPIAQQTDRSIVGGGILSSTHTTLDVKSSSEAAISSHGGGGANSSDVNSLAVLLRGGSLGSRPFQTVNSTNNLSLNPFATPSQRSAGGGGLGSAPQFLSDGAVGRAHSGHQKSRSGVSDLREEESSASRKIDLSPYLAASKQGALWSNGIVKGLLILIGGYHCRKSEAQFATRMLLGGWSAPLLTLTFALYLVFSLAAAKAIINEHWWLIVAIALYAVLSIVVAIAQARIIFAVQTDYSSLIQRVADGEGSHTGSSDHSVTVNGTSLNGPHSETLHSKIGSQPKSSSFIFGARALHYSFLLCRLPLQTSSTTVFEVITLLHVTATIAIHFAHAVVIHKAHVFSSVAEPVLATYLLVPLVLICLGSRLRFRWLVVIVAIACLFGFWAGGHFKTELGFAVSREHLTFALVSIIGVLFVAGAKEDVSREHYRRAVVVDQSLRTLQHYTVNTKKLLGDLMPLSTLGRLLQGAPVLDASKEVSTVCIEFCGSIDGIMSRTGSALLGAERLCSLLRELDAESRKFKIDFANVSGDAFWGTCGLTDSFLSTQHALKTTHFALSVVSWHPYRGVDLRIGLHSGPMASTILGTRSHSLEVVGAGANISWEVAAASAPGTVLATDSFLLCLGKQVGPSVMDRVGNKFWRLQLQCTKLPVRVARLEPTILDGESVSPLLNLHGSPLMVHINQFFDAQINPSLTLTSQAAQMVRITRKRPFKISREMAFNNKGFYYNKRYGGEKAEQQELMLKRGSVATHTDWTNADDGEYLGYNKASETNRNTASQHSKPKTVENPLSNTPLTGPTNAEIAYDAMVIQYFSNRIARFASSLVVLAATIVTLVLMLDSNSDQPPGGIAVLCLGLVLTGTGSLLTAVVYPKRLQPAVLMLLLFAVALFLVLLGLVLCDKDTKIRGNVSHAVLLFTFIWPTLSGIRIRLWSLVFTALAIFIGALLLIAPFLDRPAFDGSGLPFAEPKSIDEAQTLGGMAESLALLVLCLLLPGTMALWLDHYFYMQLHFDEGQCMMNIIHLTERSRTLLHNLLCMLVPEHLATCLLQSYHLQNIHRPIAVMDSRTLLIPRDEVEDIAAQAEAEEVDRLAKEQHLKSSLASKRPKKSTRRSKDHNNSLIPTIPSNQSMVPSLQGSFSSSTTSDSDNGEELAMTFPLKASLRAPLFPVYQWRKVPVCVLCINDLMSAQQVLASDLFNQITKVHAWVATSLSTCKNLTLLRTYGDVITIAGIGDMDRAAPASLAVVQTSTGNMDATTKAKESNAQTAPIEGLDGAVTLKTATEERIPGDIWGEANAEDDTAANLMPLPRDTPREKENQIDHPHHHRQPQNLLAAEINLSSIFSEARMVNTSTLAVHHAVLEIVFIADTKRAQTRQQRGGGGGGVGRGSYFSMRSGMHIGQACGTILSSNRLTFDLLGPSISVATKIARAAPKDRPLASEAFVEAYEAAIASEKDRRAAMAEAKTLSRNNSVANTPSKINTAADRGATQGGSKGASSPGVTATVANSSASDEDDLLPNFVDPNTYHTVVAEWAASVVLQPKTSEWSSEPLLGQELVATHPLTK